MTAYNILKSMVK